MNTGMRFLAAVCALAVLGCESPVDPVPLRAPLTELPADLAAIPFAAQGRTSAPYIMLEIRQVGGFSGFVIVNGYGQPVWFFRANNPFSFTQRSNGNFVFLDSDRGLIEVNVDGQIVRELPQEPRPGRRIHHDILATERNTVLLVAEDWQMWRDTLLNGEAIWEWSPESGTVQKRWSALDHLDPALDWGPQSVRTNWLHANAISRGPHGNTVMSLRARDQVISIAPNLQSIEWKLGGAAATLPVDDPFSGQHTAAEISPGRVLLFDNGFARTTEPYSRAAEYQITGQRARKVWEWRPTQDNWARLMSSARRLPNGNTLVGFGRARNQQEGSTGPIEVYEVTNAGTVVWHLMVGGTVNSIYRATPLFRF
ncbi:MAG: aryl-sulfate sulfotransferase [Longimicrobiales bacterium]